MTTFRKIRERRLVQIALSFVGGAWVVLEVLDQLVDRGIAPELLYKIALIWVLVGIPAALLVGWYHGEKGSQTAPKTEVVSLTLLVLVALGLSAATYTRARANAQLKAAAGEPLEMRRLAVLYFEDQTPDKKYEYVADGFTESLIEALGQVRELDVISPNGSAQFRGSDLSADSIAQILGAGTIVEGTIEGRGDEIRVDVRVIDGESGAQLGRAGFDRPASDVLALRDSLTAQTALLLRGFLGEQIRVRDAARTTANTQAWLLLQRAEKARKNAEALAPNDPAAQPIYQQAEQLLAQAEQLDASWDEPALARASMNYRRAYRLQRSPADAYPLVRKSLEDSEAVLRKDKNDARALELRGTSNYFSVLLGVVPDPAEQARLFRSAQQDLEAAIQLNPGAATAYSTLSHLYFRSGDNSNGMIAAQRALTEDAYLEAADQVLYRLFNGAWELADFTPATRWCKEGQSRFPNDRRFVSCEIRLMATTSTAEPDIDRAWALLARVDSLTPPPLKTFEHLSGQMHVAAVIARRAAREPARAQVLRDSAHAVMDAASRQVTPQLDVTGTLMNTEALLRAMIGDKDGAVALLERIKARNPDVWNRGLDEIRWYWRDLQDHPKYAELFTKK